MSKRFLSTFPVNSSVLAKLTKAGLTTVEDLFILNEGDLASEAGITQTEAHQVINTVFKQVDQEPRQIVAVNSKSSHRILLEKQDEGCIVTFCSKLDYMLDGGVHLGKLMEICGEPSVGKTQVCMQLAVDVHIPEYLGGQGGQSVYIDTEGSLVAERLRDIASAVVQHCTRAGMQTENEEFKNTCTFNVDTILSGIHIFRCEDHIELITTIHVLNKFLLQHPQVKLLIIDSIAAPFRNLMDDFSQRTRLLASVSQSLLQLASYHNIAVVITNHMTTRIQASHSKLIPALGEGWGHSCSTRLLLHWDQNSRWASLYKSTQHHPSTEFSITVGGIRDAVFEKTPESGSSTRQHPDHEDKCLLQSDLDENVMEQATCNPPAKKFKKS